VKQGIIAKSPVTNMIVIENIVFSEVVSKCQIRFKGKAQADPPSPFDESRAMAGQVEKAQHTHRM